MVGGPTERGLEMVPQSKEALVAPNRPCESLAPVGIGGGGGPSQPEEQSGWQFANPFVALWLVCGWNLQGPDAVVQDESKPQKVQKASLQGSL